MDTFEKLIHSLKNDEWNLEFGGGYILRNKDRTIGIWRDNMPVFNTNVYEPCPLKLSLWQKFCLYRACLYAQNKTGELKLSKLLK